MPRLIRLYIDSVLVGLALGVVFATGLVLLNVGGLQARVLGSPEGFGAIGLVTLFSGGVFASVQFSIAVMRMAVRDDRAAEHRRRHGWGKSPRDRDGR